VHYHFQKSALNFSSVQPLQVNSIPPSSTIPNQLFPSTRSLPYLPDLDTFIPPNEEEITSDSGLNQSRPRRKSEHSFENDNAQLIETLLNNNSKLTHDNERLKQQITELQIPQKALFIDITLESIKDLNLKRIQELELKLRTSLQIVEQCKQILIEKDTTDQKYCIICSEDDKNIVFVPCGHLCCCSFCAKALKQCPICRTLIKQQIKTFIS